MKTATQKKILTSNVLELSFGDKVSEAIEAARESYMDYPTRPTKPILARDSNSAQARKFASDLEAYETEKAAYDAAKDAARDHNSKIDEEIEKYIKEVSGFNKYIPEDKKSKVWSKAWEDGHSSGYHEVYLHLVGLVDLFS
jgi:hypothetical protein